jgi:GPI mannosyltransferase 3
LRAALAVSSGIFLTRIYLLILLRFTYHSGENLSTYRDETDIFFTGPAAFLSTKFPVHVDATFPPSVDAPYSRAWPSHLVLFGALLHELGVEDVLRAKGYTEVWRGGSGIEEDRRRRGGVRVWRWDGSNTN